MNRAVIITSYLENPLDIPALIGEDDTIICLDGGYDIAKDQGIQPDILLGDFDSIKSPIPDDEDIQVLKYPAKKDFSDLELALRLLDPRDYPKILIIGGIGGRQDQTAINMHLVTRYSRPVVKGSVAFPDPSAGPEDSSRPFERIDIMDGSNHCFAVHGATTACCWDGRSDEDEEMDPTATVPVPTVVQIPREPDSYLSLIPMTGFCEEVTLTGALYPLEKATLRRGSSLSISNEFDSESATLSVRAGSLLVVVSKK